MKPVAYVVLASVLVNLLLIWLCFRSGILPAIAVWGLMALWLLWMLRREP